MPASVEITRAGFFILKKNINGLVKINEALIKMFSEFISYKILTIKDYYQYIENIPMDEEEDNYRINILNFLYENIIPHPGEFDITIFIASFR